MRPRHATFLGFLAFLIFLAPVSVEAQKVCKKGKPCGNTCIARNKVCRVGRGSARAATPSRTGPVVAPVTVPEGAMFVASSRGRVYYWVGCSAWRRLSRANLRFFKSRTEAEQAGYTPSRSRGCAGPATAETSAPQPSPRAGAVLGPRGKFDPALCAVVRVVDGDTVECADGRSIRLLLIDAPEMDQGPFGEVAKKALEALLPTGTMASVELDVDPTDDYGRTLAYLGLLDGRIVNEELLRAGVAVVSVYPPNVKYVERFRAVAEQAREARRGLWALNAFDCLPADYRAGKCRVR